VFNLLGHSEKNSSIPLLTSLKNILSDLIHLYLNNLVAKPVLWPFLFPLAFNRTEGIGRQLSICIQPVEASNIYLIYLKPGTKKIVLCFTCDLKS